MIGNLKENTASTTTYAEDWRGLFSVNVGDSTYDSAPSNAKVRAVQFEGFSLFSIYIKEFGR